MTKNGQKNGQNWPKMVKLKYDIYIPNPSDKTSQELRMLSSVTINCQVPKIVMNSGSQLSEL